MKICVRAHDVACDSPEAVALGIKKFGFDGAQLVPNKVIKGFDTQNFNKTQLQNIATGFADNGIEVVMLGAYFNPVHSDKNLVKSKVQYFERILDAAKLFVCGLVGTETGSYNDDKWTYHPKNRTEEAYIELKNIFSQLADKAKQCGACLALEGAFGHVAYCPERLARLIEDIDNGNVKAIVDLYNYLDISNYGSQREIFDRCCRLLGDKIEIIHLKDFIVDNGKLKQVGLGQGIMDLPYLVGKTLKLNPHINFVFEGVNVTDIPSSLEYLKKIIEEA